MRKLLYTGKGGVGKTTTSAATAAWAVARARANGHKDFRALVASADAAHSLGDVLGRDRLGPVPVEVAPGLDAVEIDPRVELERRWGRIHGYLVSLLRHQGIEEMVADELALLPGAEEITTLLAARGMANEGAYDLIVVDCAPTGSALRLLTAPDVVRSAARWLLRLQRGVAAIATPLARNLVAIPLPEAAVFREAEHLLYSELDGLRSWLTESDAHVRLVATPERIAVEEALRAHTDLALFGLACDVVIANRVLPPDAAREPFFHDAARRQAETLDVLRDAVAPVPLLLAALGEDEVIGIEALTAHGAELFGVERPDAILCHQPGLRFEATARGARVHLPLPHVAPGDLDVVKLDAELLLRTPTRRRALPLPRHLASYELTRALLRDGELRVDLERQPGATR